mmetsp:Transcript_66399/g.130891  ORF Transcript_66399/g.130891 Transcript_66399/m.130891 type:complete len:625 (+) Transcript_66399:85-1959(+)
MMQVHVAAVVLVATVAAQDALGGTGQNGGFTTLNPDPNLLIWDPPTTVGPKKFRAGWLSVPVMHDPYLAAFEAPPHRCLRVIMKPARKQPAKLGPVMLHCGGPGSDASCAVFLGEMLEINSTYVVGDPLSDDYDYWSISQRGMQQLVGGFDDTPCPFKSEDDQTLPVWPEVDCTGINDLINKEGIEAAIKRLDGDEDDATKQDMLDAIRSGPDAQKFGFALHNETYVRWLYRIAALESNLCFHDPKYLVSSAKNRSYNILEHTSTVDLAYDIELVREAIGAQKMSVYGVSYGTKVGSVYATIFPDKVHRLILDGDMGSGADVREFANWVGQSTEAVWTGLAMACDNSVMAGRPTKSICPAGPGSTRKLHRLLLDGKTDEDRANALALLQNFEMTVYQPDVPGAADFMRCLEATFSSRSMSKCRLHPRKTDRYNRFAGLEVIGHVLGLDFAGRLTETSLIEWWRSEKEAQPLGVTRSLFPVVTVGTWPAVPRPDPPATSSTVAPLIIGNLHDGQTPYKNAQRMLQAFPSGRLLTSQFYGHGLHPPDNVDEVVKRYEDEMRKGEMPTYDDEVAKLLCVKVALEYLKEGVLPRDYVCKARGPIETGPGTNLVRPRPSLQPVVGQLIV